MREHARMVAAGDKTFIPPLSGELHNALIFGVGASAKVSLLKDSETLALQILEAERRQCVQRSEGSAHRISSQSPLCKHARFHGHSGAVQ